MGFDRKIGEFSWKKPCLLGQEAKEKATYLIAALDNEDKGREILSTLNNQVSGFWIENGKYIAFDNTTGDVWVEDFDNILQAYLWCTNQIEFDEKSHYNSLV